MKQPILPKAYIINFRNVEEGIEINLLDANTREIFFTAPEIYKNESMALEKVRFWVESLTPNDWDSIRQKRNELLDRSDWALMTDSPLNQSQKQVWCLYRQTLRDIPQTFTNPEDVIWPTKPS